MKQETLDRWRDADADHEIWMAARGIVSEIVTRWGVFGSTQHSERLARMQAEIDRCEAIMADAERDGLRELERDPADDWLREAMNAQPDRGQHYRDLLAKVTVYPCVWE